MFKKYILFLVVGLCAVLGLRAQAPFTSLIREPIVVEKDTTPGGENRYKEVDEQEAIKFLESLSSASRETDDAVDADEEKEKTEKKAVDFFANNSLSLSLLNKGINRLSVSSQVLHYKFYIANPAEDDTDRKNRYNLPFFLITRLSSNYDSLQASSALDVLDYEAAPFTMRLMPSWKITSDKHTDILFLGLYTDLRAINLFAGEAANADVRLVGSGGIGFTYQGDGQAGVYNKFGESVAGRYSFSVMLQGALGDKDLMEQLFETESNVVGSIQSYLFFKANSATDNQSLNVKIGYQYFFQPTQAGSQHNFTVALGI
ncbi:MAG: hypothetical protein AAF206_13100 [Bacteroidota bacterium]